MRRASVLGPLILIGVGLLFLLRNLFPDLGILDFLARNWPFLLIAWGVLRLIEVIYWASSASPLPRNGISGGEWVLVIFLCLFGSGLSAVHNYDGRNWWRNAGINVGGIDLLGENFEYQIAAQKQVGKNPRILIESFRGNAHVVGGDGELLKVTGRKNIKSLQQGDADKANQQTPLEIVYQGDNIVIRTNQDRAAGRLRLDEDLEITLPRASTVEARGRVGDFEISDITGNVEVISDNAGVRVQNIGGNVRVDLRKSDIIRAIGVKGLIDLKGRGNDIDLQNVDGQVTINGTYSGILQFRSLSMPLHLEEPQTTFNVEKIPGQVRMSLGDLTATNIVGPTRLTTRSRDVQISEFTNNLDMSVDRGDVDLRPGRAYGKIDVQSRAGDIELSLLPAAKFSLKATTNRGEITNDYGSPLHAESQGRGTSLSGSSGDGPAITLSTNVGAVTIRKATGDEAGSKTPAVPKTPKVPDFKAEEQ